MKNLTLGFSPCPNDTFIFDALVHGRVESDGIEYRPHLADVEALNRQALAGTLDITKVSYGVLPFLLDNYVLLKSGGALGRGCGPLLVSKDPNLRLESARIAIPGVHTTANLLLRLFAASLAPGVEMTYEAIMPAVAEGRVDAGLIIHESRFTYPDYGLTRIVDLGAWWEEETRAPIPLGAIVARRDLGDRLPVIESSIRRSVEYAFSNPNASAPYVRAHAQEMSDAVMRSHIDLYVNEYSVNLGTEGEDAVRELLRRAADAGLLPSAMRDPFAGSASTQT